MTIDILCKVVDNFGDIGVVYRLARSLSDLDPNLKLRLIVDDLAAFRALEPSVDPTKSLQEVRGWLVAGWNRAETPFRADRPRRVIECFACGRPDWFEELLFEPQDNDQRLIVNLEHLTAEDFAAEFHLLPTPTRSATVRKAMFMPGFVPGTGGLIIDRRFRELREAHRNAGRRADLRRNLLDNLPRSAGPATAGDPAEAFWVPVFSYERDYRPLIADLGNLHRRRPVLALAAAGRSSDSFLDSWEAADRPFPVLRLPFLPQETWDEVILAADFSVVRGEDSFSRAALSGRPFLWHCYPLAGGDQMPKVEALLGRLRPFFTPGDFASLERTMLAFNADNETGAAELLFRCAAAPSTMEASFAAWSDRLWDLGNLAEKLLTFIRDFG